MKVEFKKLFIKEKFIFLAILFVIIHFIFLLFFFKPAISTPDAQGYFVQAKIIAQEGKTEIEPESIIQYLGPHWLNSGNNSYYTSFPPGLPVIIAFIYKSLGENASLLINPIMASLSLLGLFFICRLWIGKGWGLFAIALMFVNPTFNEHALYGDSHISVIFFLIWSVFFLAKWIKTNSQKWAFLTGLFIGIIPTIRYPEFLFSIAFGIFIILNFKKLSKKSIFTGIAGFLIPTIALSIRNQIAFNGFWKTGYGLAQESHFSFSNIINNVFPYLQKLIFQGLGLIFVIGIIGIIIMVIKKKLRNRGIFFSLLVIPITILYMSYFWKPDPQSMRFLLPTFFIYTISTVWLISNIKDKKLVKISIVLLLITVIFWGLPPSLLMMEQQKKNNSILTEITDIVKDKIEPDNIIITYEGISQQLDFVGSWKLTDISILNTILPNSHNNVLSDRRRPLRNLEARERYKNLTDIELFKTFKKDIWEWAGNNSEVYLIIKENYLTELYKFKSPDDSFVIVDSFIIKKENQNNIISRLLPSRGRPQSRQNREPMENQRLIGPNQIYDLIIDEKPYFIIHWKKHYLVFQDNFINVLNL